MGAPIVGVSSVGIGGSKKETMEGLRRKIQNEKDELKQV
jgi:hypothetical protein